KNPPERVFLNQTAGNLPASQFFQRGTDIGQAVNGFHTGVFQGSKLLCCGAFTTGNDGASVAHALTGRCSHTRNVRHHRLGDVGFDESRRFFFGAATDLTDHYDGFGFRVFLEQFQDVDKVGTRDRVTTNTYTGRLTKTVISGLFNGFIGQRTGTGNDTHFTRQVNVARHNADFAFTGGDHARAVRADQAYAQLITLHFGIQHIQRRNAFGDADDQLDAAVSCFQNGIFTEGGWYVDNRGFCTGGFYRFFNSIEHRQTQVSRTTLARSYTANHFGAVGNGLFRVKSTLCAGKALADHFGVFVD